MTTILTVQGVEKNFGARRVLSSVSFAVDSTDRIALVGVNGSGKSTLLRLLVGSHADPAFGADAAVHDPRESEPDAGLITRRRGLHVEYVPQEPKLPVTQTVQEALRQGMRRHAEVLAELETLAQDIETSDGEKRDAAIARQAELHEHIKDLGGFDVDHEIRGIAASLELPPMDAVIGNLSIGERRRVALAAALLARPELLMLDEPTNHLDARTVEWLENRLRSQPGALVLVTHDRYFLDRVATRILEIDRGRIYAYEGNYQRFLEKQAERLDTEASRERERAMFVRRELDWIRRGPAARTTKQKARIDRFNEAVAQKPKAEDKSTVDRRLILRLPTGGRLGKTILEMRGISKSIGGKKLFSDLQLILKPGDRIGIIGGNGAGKTTLVRTLIGELLPDAGEVVRGVNTRIAFLDQGRAELDDSRSVLEEVAGDSDSVFLEDGPVHVRTFLRMLLFDDRFADAKVATLSGGERNRVQLAKLLRRGGNLLILDEPTNDLDLLTLGVLEEALAEFPGCALVVSHDRWFLDHVATGILAFEGNGKVSFHEGNYSDYLERTKGEAKADAESIGKTAKPQAPASKASAAADKAEPPKNQSKPRKLTFAEQNELAKMEENILAAESEAEALSQKLSDPSVYKDHATDVPGWVASLDKKRADIERLYARWQELESLAAQSKK
ncbi:MAG TPA: ATP-binding cassette domain-containing protein [Pseudomonadota bacterium]|nr:ATP-binding cassette domain-containing protein [Pseudomonadota bacterium]HNI59262.1 ATP-binding cassette domain-containing protein [Pseudomonadota bacterium]